MTPPVDLWAYRLQVSQTLSDMRRLLHHLGELKVMPEREAVKLQATLDRIQLDVRRLVLDMRSWVEAQTERSK